MKTDMEPWKPGQVIVLREIWLNKVYSVIPVRVVQDSPSWCALYLPPQTPCLWPRTREGGFIRIPTDEWILDREAWTRGNVLYLVQPGSGYTAIAFWDNGDNFDHWKINLEQPMRRVPTGFDYMDQTLDIIVSADRSAWRWKDENELEQAHTLGIFSRKETRAIRAKGERAIQSLLDNEPPFDGGWENWKPNPDWRVPLDLPEGWDHI